MPELPEVRTVVRSLQPLVGWTIRKADLPRPQVLRDETGQTIQVLVGRRITAISAHGKQIWFTLDRGPLLHAHLGMTGNFRRHLAGAVRVKHAHAVFTLCKSVWPSRPRLRRIQKRNKTDTPGGGRATCELHFVDSRRFGGLWLVADERRKKALGPDAYNMTRAEFEQAVAGGRRQLKALLLDQRKLAGLGNIYADESLHRAGLHPLRRASTLKPAERQKLFRAIKAVLRLAVNLGGSTLRDHRDAEGEKGWFQIRHRVYGRAGQPCKTCHTPIATAQIAGRTTCWCPQCQKQRSARRS